MRKSEAQEFAERLDLIAEQVGQVIDASTKAEERAAQLEVAVFRILDVINHLHPERCREIRELIQDLPPEAYAEEGELAEEGAA